MFDFKFSYGYPLVTQYGPPSARGGRANFESATRQPGFPDGWSARRENGLATRRTAATVRGLARATRKLFDSLRLLSTFASHVCGWVMFANRKHAGREDKQRNSIS